jgi:hypothetical protein
MAYCLLPTARSTASAIASLNVASVARAGAWIFK